MIGVVAVFGILHGAKFMVPLISCFFGILQMIALVSPGAATAIVPALGDKMITLGWVFMLGATAAVYSDRIPLRNEYGLGAIMLVLVTLRWGGFYLIGVPAFVYATIWVAVVLPNWFHRIGAKNDYSYGIYLYGWPVQQALAAVGLQHKLVVFTALSLVGAMIMAWASWHGIEKWAILLKDVHFAHTKRTPTREYSAIADATRRACQ